jgi:hypothetical protein
LVYLRQRLAAYTNLPLLLPPPSRTPLLQVSQIFPLMAQLAGLPLDTQLQAYEEVKWEPTVMICSIDPQASLHQVRRVRLLS